MPKISYCLLKKKVADYVTAAKNDLPELFTKLHFQKESVRTYSEAYLEKRERNLNN